MSPCLDNRVLLAQLTTPEALVKAYVKAMASVHDGQSHFLQTISEILVDVEDNNTFQSTDLNLRAIIIVCQMRIIAILAHREIDQEACRRRRRRRRESARGDRRGGERALTQQEDLGQEGRRGQQAPPTDGQGAIPPPPTRRSDHDQRRRLRVAPSPSRMALEVPIALLPPDHHVCNMSHASAARELPSTWDWLNGGGHDGPLLASSALTVIMVLQWSGRFASAVFSLVQHDRHEDDHPWLERGIHVCELSEGDEEGVPICEGSRRRRRIACRDRCSSVRHLFLQRQMSMPARCDLAATTTVITTLQWST